MFLFFVHLSNVQLCLFFVQLSRVHCFSSAPLVVYSSECSVQCVPLNMCCLFHSMSSVFHSICCVCNSVFSVQGALCSVQCAVSWMVWCPALSGLPTVIVGCAGLGSNGGHQRWQRHCHRRRHCHQRCKKLEILEIYLCYFFFSWC